MNDKIQKIVTPHGDVMVVMTLEHFERLSVAASSFILSQAKNMSIQASDGREHSLIAPASVRLAIAEGKSPLEAWRCHRQMSQSALARAAGVSRFTIMRIESAGAGAGNRKSRDLLATALGIPASAI